MNYCNCKKCNTIVKVENWKIDEDDRLNVFLECGHKRVYQLITSSEDYK